MKKNTLSGKLWAVDWLEDPPFFPHKKLTAAQQAGLRFERKIGKEVERLYPEHEIKLGPWITYKDDSGRHIAQPDILIVPEVGPVRLLECKLKYRPEAEGKVRKLYVPLITRLMGRPVAPFQVCKHLGLFVDAVYDLYSVIKESENDPDKYRVIQHL